MKGTGMGTDGRPGQTEQLARILEMFAEATPGVGAPIEDWRAGFDRMCASFPIPDDAHVEVLDMDGVPGRLVRAPWAEPDRVIVHFHSGGYFMGSSMGYLNFAYRISQATGCTVVVPDYRLAPENPYPAAVEDAVTVYSWVLKSVEPNRLVVSGDSAGGGLAMACLLATRDRGLPRAAAGFAISPLLDLAGEGDSAVTNDGIDPLINQTMIVEMGKVYIGDIDPHTEPGCSPLWGEHHDLPPLLLMASNSEVLRDDSVRFAGSVVRAGGTAEVYTPEGMVHIWTLFPELEEAQATVERIGSFVRSHVA